MMKLFPIFVNNKSSSSTSHILSDDKKLGNSIDTRKSTKRKVSEAVKSNGGDEIFILEDTVDIITLDYKKVSIINDEKVEQKERLIKNTSKKKKKIQNNEVNVDSLATNCKNKILNKEFDFAPFENLYHVLQNVDDKFSLEHYKLSFPKVNKISKENIKLDDKLHYSILKNVENSFYIGYTPSQEEISRIFHIDMNHFMQAWYTYGAELRDKGYLEKSLLCTAIKPLCSGDFLNNCHPVDKLKLWLSSWKNKIENPVLYSKSHNNIESDSENSMEIGNYMDIAFNPLLLVGPYGIGKTSAIKHAAENLNFNIISLGSDERRNSASVLAKLSGAITNFRVIDAKSAMNNFFQPKQKVVEKKLGMTCIVIEDVDIIFEDDEGFWSALKNICIDSKVPIILTCVEEKVPIKELTKLISFHEKRNILQFDYISVNALVDYIQSVIFGAYKYYLNKSYLKQLIRDMKTDVRGILHHLQYILSTGLQVVYKKESNFISEDICFMKKSYLMNEILHITNENRINYLPDFSEEFAKENHDLYCCSQEQNLQSQGNTFHEDYLDIIDNLRCIRFADGSTRTELASEMIDILKVLDIEFDNRMLQSRRQTSRHPFSRLNDLLKYPYIVNLLRKKIKKCF
uniref:ATPase_AAA_core domain-containing protein n=1 Tax=Parastrongyloides trichosuri TaxID=131310 RepID=A0A0N4ZS41_PARTI